MANNNQYQALLTAAISPQGQRNIENQIKAISKKYKLNLEVNVNDISKVNRKIQDQIKKTKTQLKIEDATGITQVEDKKAKAYIATWEKAINKRIKLEQDAQIKIEQAQAKQFWTNYSSGLGVGSTSKSAKDSASVFEEVFKKAEKGTLGLSKMERQVANLNGGFKLFNKNGYSLVSMLETAASKIVVWALATGAIYGTLRQIEQGVQYIIQLDNAMNEIRIVTGMTKTEVNDLAQSYNKLAKEMKTTTAEIASVSVELYRQGLNGKELDDRLQAIVKYAKISKISLQESEKILTATANATKRDVGSIIDIFAYLGDMTA